MKLLDVLRCARPVLFENDDATFPYSIGGSAFVAKFRDRHYVITAKHVLNIHSFLPDQFRVQYRPDFNGFIPLAALHTFRVNDPEDTDQFEVAVWKVDESGLREELFGDYSPYNLLSIDTLTIFSPASKYIYRGFPTVLRDWNWDKKSMRQDAVLAQAQYIGRASWAYVHKLQLMSLDPLSSVDGLSG
jgi:hypothetical protein